MMAKTVLMVLMAMTVVMVVTQQVKVHREIRVTLVMPSVKVLLLLQPMDPEVNYS